MRAGALLVLALVAGCGLVGGAAGTDLRTTLTRAQIDADGVPKVFVELDRFGYQSLFSLTARNRDVTTWVNDQGASVSLRDGLLIATRGFPDDLMSSDFSATARALASGASGGSYPRFQTGLDGDHAVKYQTQQCKIASRVPERVAIFGREQAALRVTERCALPGRTEDNTYWIATGGPVVKSRQWLGDSLGHMMIERLD